MSLQFARNQAEHLIRTLKVQKPPVDVEEVAKFLKVPIVEMHLGSDVSGMLVTNAKSASICVAETDAETRRRFTVAHEIGHLFLRHQFEPGEHVHVDRGNFISHRGVRASQGIDPKEIEANQFAASLLMPITLLRGELAQIPQRPLFDTHVMQLAKRFNVSEQAMTIRLSGLGLI